MNPLLQTIAEQAAEDLRALIEEGGDDILSAIHKAEKQAQVEEKKPKFNMSFSISVDFDKRTYDCDLSWNLKHKLSTSHTIDDPNQGNLPIEGEVVIGAEDAKAIAAGLDKVVKQRAGRK